MNHEAVYALYPNVVKIVHDVAYDINDNVVDLDLDAVNSWVNPNAYKEQRMGKYPPLGEQLDMLYHAIDTNETLKTQFNDFYTAIKTVKDNYPK